MPAKNRYADNLCRWFLALVYVVFGLNGFVTFIPIPELHPFVQLLVASGYIYAIKLIEVFGGLLLLRRQTVIAGLVVLTPVTVNVCLYHALLDHRNWVVAVLLALANIVLIGNRFERIRNLVLGDDARSSGESR